MDTRRELVEFSKRMTIAKADEISIPTIEIEPIVGLKVFKGLICDTCDAIYGSVWSMEDHCREKHGWRRWQGSLIVRFKLI
jgi:hypothetical protein